jgi:hypothetical protein
LESTTTSVSSDDGASTVVVTFNTEETITAGTTHTYSLKGLLNNFLASSSGNDSVATNMLTDSSSNGTLASPLVYPYYTTGTIYQLASQAANGGSDATNFSIIWSDNSATSHSDAITSSGSNDFINGYLLPGVTTDTSTVSAI